MPRSHRRWLWTGRLLALMLLIGLAIYLRVVGLEKADKVGSSAGLIVAIAALVGPYLLPTQWRPSRSSAPSRQLVTGSIVGGDTTQVQDVAGSVTLSESHSNLEDPSTTRLAPHSPDLPTGSPADLPDGQVVSGTWVGGDITQIDNIDGNVEL